MAGFSRALSVTSDTTLELSDVKALLGRRSLSQVAYVFDFDGVLISPLEDMIYRLPVEPWEHRKLTQLAKEFHISASFYETDYLRHLVVQALLFARGKLPEAGPFAKLAVDLKREGNPVFILTARSGLYAVSRMMQFFSKIALEPDEIFAVGRVAKGRQLNQLLKAQSGKLMYFEDSRRHLRNARVLADASLFIIDVRWPSAQASEDLNARGAYLDLLQWFDKSRTALKKIALPEAVGAVHGKVLRSRNQRSKVA